jgi:hypothetical protein
MSETSYNWLYIILTLPLFLVLRAVGLRSR